nr:aldo/keto reductase [Afifella pfennigii]
MAAGASLPGFPLAAGAAPGTRRIPSSGEAVPAVGLGTWITFNVGNDPLLLERSARVMEAFFAGGGRVIDSSPMYGSSQATLGYGFDRLGRPEGLFAADKVWTSSQREGPAQMARSRRAWKVPRFSLMQVHNLRGWEAHLPMLLEKKAAGEIGYVGITTSEGRRHGLFEEIMARETLDAVQVTYNPLDREVEERILPLAAERGTAVIVNRPFRQGALTRRLEGEKLPDFAAEIGASSWAQLILKFILAHPAVTVVIPATTRPEHASENMAASGGPLPDAAMRERISAAIGGL